MTVGIANGKCMQARAGDCQLKQCKEGELLQAAAHSCCTPLHMTFMRVPFAVQIVTFKPGSHVALTRL